WLQRTQRGRLTVTLRTWVRPLSRTVTTTRTLPLVRLTFLALALSTKGALVSTARRLPPTLSATRLIAPWPRCARTRTWRPFCWHEVVTRTAFALALSAFIRSALVGTGVSGVSGVSGSAGPALTQEESKASTGRPRLSSRTR